MSFSDIAAPWRDAGWLGTVPLPENQKNPPPTGWTGRNAGFPDDAQVADWSQMAKYENPNIGLHLGWPVTVNGIEYETAAVDVDHYPDGDKDKRGHDQLAALQKQLGTLPPTWVSTARAHNDDGSDRGDWKSGIRFYLVPRGLAFRGQADRDIEVIQKNHRFAVVWPSWNPKSESTYRLYSPEQWAIGESGGPGQPSDEIPVVTTLPLLPARWVDYLTRDRTPDDGHAIDMDSTVDEIQAWALNQFNDGDDASACDYLVKVVSKWHGLITDEATSHDKIRDAHWEITNLGAEGCGGWSWALAEVDRHWIEDVMSRSKRSVQDMRGEMFRSKINALRKVKAKVDQAEAKRGRYTPDYCLHSPQMKSTGTNVIVPQLNSAPVVSQATFTDSGLAEVIVRDTLRGNFLRVAGGNSWLQWDGLRWRNLGKDDGPVVEAVRQYNLWQLADAAEKLAQNPGDSSALELVKAWKRTTSAARITAVLKLARNLVSVDAAAIDADPYLLNTPSGTYDLHACEFASHSADNHLTRITVGGYLQSARDSVADVPRYGVRWSAFLERIIPDAETRRYLQKVMGMALVGRLKEKKLFIFNGAGDNGKNVFWEAIHFALGDVQTGGYATISRADLLEADGKDRQLLEMGLKNARVAFISETNKQVALAEGIVKKLTGDKLITSRTHYQEHETFTQSATVVLITNKLPTFTGSDVAMKNRLRVIPFSVQIPEAEQDKNLGEALELEADAVLTWLIDGYCEYLEHGLEEPDEIKLATANYHLDNDVIARAIDAVCVVDDSVKSERKEVKDAILTWLRIAGSSTGGASAKQNEILAALTARGHAATRSNGKVWLHGIRLKTEDERIAETSEQD